jgi:hypothetical protein
MTRVFFITVWILSNFLLVPALIKEIDHGQDQYLSCTCTVYSHFAVALTSLDMAISCACCGVKWNTKYVSWYREGPFGAADTKTKYHYWITQTVSLKSFLDI